MSEGKEEVDDELRILRERAKELRCLYDVNSALTMRGEPPQEIFRRVLDAIPPAWKYPEDTTARIEYFGRTHARPDFIETPWRMHSPISIWRTPVGSIEVVYKRPKPEAWGGPFLREEQQLLDSIAQRIGEFLEWKQRELGGERLGAEPEHWKWRERFAERIAASIDPVRFGVSAVYLIGSTQEGTAGPGSDIDLIVVCQGDQRERDLKLWLEGWSLCLGEVTLQLHGLPSSGLLDVKLLHPKQAEAEIQALMRGGVAARSLALGAAPVLEKQRERESPQADGPLG